jgi:hypothetical protein
MKEQNEHSLKNSLQGSLQHAPEKEGTDQYVPGQIISKITGYVEVVIAALILVALLVATVKIILYFPVLWSADGTEGFTEIIGYFFTVIIGIEIIHMLSKHTPGSALEVVLFCIARYIIVSEGSGLDKLLAVSAIGVIFVIRKYAFVHSFEE